MNNTLNLQLYSLIIYVLSGITIGLFFDIFRILRRTFKTPDFITHIEDITFLILTGFFLLFVLLKFNNGNIRVYIILSIIIGFIIYLITISKFVIKINVKIISVIKCIIKSILKFILYPLKILFKLLNYIFYKPINFCIINFKKILTNFIKKIINMTQYINKSKKNKKKSYGKKDFEDICRKI